MRRLLVLIQRFTDKLARSHKSHRSHESYPSYCERNRVKRSPISPAPATNTAPAPP